MRRVCSVLVALLAQICPVAAETLTGAAEVLDSDLLQLGDYRIYLFGVESIESEQTCAVGEQTWECYPAAVRMLQTIVSGGDVGCQVISGPDFLDQVIARCSIAGEDIGERFVSSGFGIALSDETAAYDGAMAAAKEQGLGLWKSRFALPSAWRYYMGILADRPPFRPSPSAN